MSDLALKLIAENKKTRAPFLDLGNCGLTGIQEELAELEWLEELSFASEWSEFDGKKWNDKKSVNIGPPNKITSLSCTVPVFSKLVHLKNLWLNGQYNKRFDFDDLSPLVGVTGLNLLDVSHTHVSDLSPMSGLTGLKQLDVSDTQVSDLRPLSCLAGLQLLYVSDTQVSDLSPLASLAGLRQLDVSRTQVGDLSPLSGLAGLQLVDVSGTQVSNLSPLSGLAGLRNLNVFRTQVGDLGPLSCLASLQSLDVSHTQVGDLSPLSGLAGLQKLYVSGTQVSNLSPLSGLTGLRNLHVFRTQVSDLGPLVGLTALQALYASDTQVRDLSPLSGLAGLQRLHVSDTKVSDLGPLSGLTGLQLLEVSGTQVSDLGPLSGLTGLRQLDVSNAQVSDLSPVLNLIARGIPVKWSRGRGQWSEGIYLEDCPLSNPPVEVVKQGNEAILNYFREQETQGVDHLYEAKLLIIGEGGAGKTSLLRRLYQPAKPMPEEQESTKGIDIYRHDFSLKNGRTFRLNVWDFGGQEIYHATHQFFLTKRSLYILLDDTRKDYKSVHDEGFKYWLEVVDLLGGHSPLLVFQNEKSGRSKIIDQSGIKGRFDNVKDFYSGDLQQADAADSLREAIEFYAQQLPHIGEALPAKWVVIREEIEALAVNKPFITLRKYFDIYSRHLEFDRAKALYLSEYLHDLGVFLHFQDDRLLARTVILQNQWATEAVFKILDDEAIKAKLGHFDAADCGRLWQDSVYADMHPELLALMQKFELCYRLPDTTAETWLAPQLLSPSKPADLPFNNEPGDLVLRYHYPFLPKGLVSRLIVRMHRFVRRPEWSWSSGVLFEQGESELLAEIPARGSEIMLRARGPERKELLSVIAADLDALNATFHGLPEKVDKLVPCNCRRCRQLADSEFFNQKRLLQRKEDGKFSIECPGSYEDVAVLELLDGINVKHMPGWAEDKEKQVLANLETEPSERTIKIFLASSSELKEDRDAFDLYFRQQNDLLKKQGIYLQIVRWENFLDAMSDKRLQDEYNKAVKDCDIFVSLFFTKTGKFTEEEFDTAYLQFKATGKPLVHTFFKNAPINSGEISDEVMTLLAFKKKLFNLGHFYTGYDNIADLKLQFENQLKKLYPSLLSQVR